MAKKPVAPAPEPEAPRLSKDQLKLAELVRDWIDRGLAVIEHRRHHGTAVENLLEGALAIKQHLDSIIAEYDEDGEEDD
jgi:hypothetical protein